MPKLTLKQEIYFIVGIVATLTPTVLVAILASFYYYLGVESFFDDRVRKAISDTVKVAHLYFNEHKENIKADIYAVANNIERNYYVLLSDPSLLTRLFDAQVHTLNLSEAVLFTKDKIIGRNTLGFSLLFEKLPTEAISAADETDGAVILKNDSDDKVRAILRLHNFIDHTYLLIGRYVDREIINYLAETTDSAEQYATLWGNVGLTRNKLIYLFVIVSALLCSIAMLISSKLANVIIKPLIELVDATKLIKAGNFTARVPESKNLNEISMLAKAFNSMTERIAIQRSELIQANELIDARRRFIETILVELSAGVLALNEDYTIALCNHAVYKLLRIPESKSIIGLNVQEVIPEIYALITAENFLRTYHVEQHLILRRENYEMHLLLRIGAVRGARRKLESIIITFSDITDLVAAQRSTAWTEIAKRIAHEVKNPLTPIHLAAERLKKKYMPQVYSEAETFVRYIDTIIRHVTDIEFMLSEFLDFARIPAPKFAKHDLLRTIREALLLQQNAHPDILYDFHNEEGPCYVLCDRAQVSQILTNLLKNAAESISEKSADLAGDKGFKGKINIILERHAELQEVTVKIQDNGKGVDSSMINQVAEPYITTKIGGTGLGLSIVKKLVADHEGKFVIYNEAEGASAAFSLKLLMQGSKI